MSEKGQKTDPPHNRKANVLIVDDNPQYARIFELLSEDLEINTVVVSSCKEALHALNESEFNLVLMDWCMPEIDGMGCAKCIREQEQANHRKRIPILGVSGYLTADLEQSLEAGMDDFLAVPFTYKELNDKLTKLLGES